MEAIETKVLVWERAGRGADTKRVLLEASEPAAYKTVKPLIEFLQQDERCGAITLVTDNVAGKNFMDERDSLGLTQVRDPAQPVFADIAGPFDSVLVLTEPKNSPNVDLLFGGRSVYGNDSTKIYCMLDGMMGSTTRTLFTSADAGHMDSIDGVFVANDLAKELLVAAVPSLTGRVEAVGSLLLQQFKNSLPDPVAAEEGRRSMREALSIPQDAVVVLYSGFPSNDFAAFNGQADTDALRSGKTLNQETFGRTLEALKTVAAQNTDKTYALLVRTHPRASGVDNDLSVPAELPDNLHVIRTDSPTFNYDDIADAADLIACMSTSTEVLYAPYRGVTAAVLGYKGEGMQDEINKQIFGQAMEAFKHAEGIAYIDSEESLEAYISSFEHRPVRKVIPEDPTSRIADMLLAGGPSPVDNKSR